MQQDIRILKQKCSAAISRYVLAKFGKVWSTHPWESSVSSDPPPKIAREKSQSFITSQTIRCKCLRSKVEGEGHGVK